MKKRIITCVLLAVLLMSLFSACGDPEPVVDAEPVTLTIAGSWEDCKAIETVGAMFTEQYPNCTVVYESINDYYTNLAKRMEGEDMVDIFFSSTIQTQNEETVAIQPYALDLNSAEGLDLSNTFAPLMENFMYRDDPSQLYAIPLGAEMRGMFVNKTLLESVGIEKTPTNQEELLADCEILKQAGYIPMQGNPGVYGQWLIYPWICSNIANADDPESAWAAVESKDAAAMTELLREPLEFAYELTANYYYDYKTAQKTLDLFNDSAQEDHGRYFFNIVADGNGYKKKDDTAGQIAFMPAPISYKNTLEQTKEDYSSDIEYEFIPAPVGKDGGYVYLSPAHGIAANKNSANLEWSIKFLNYLFTPEVNTVFAEQFNIMPNVKEAFNYVSSLYDVPENHVCHLGQVTFSWSFYDTMQSVIIEIVKANKPDTISENGGKIQEFDHFLDILQENINAAT